ncbi:MAG: rhodanese-like domain-containing protein, partial [Polyangiales bacterium]
MTVKRVSPLEAAALLEDEGYVYLDVRSIPEFDQGHAVGAYNIPVLPATPSGMRPNGDFMSVVAAVFPKDSKLVLG